MLVTEEQPSINIGTSYEYNIYRSIIYIIDEMAILNYLFSTYLYVKMNYCTCKLIFVYQLTLFEKVKKLH